MFSLLFNTYKHKPNEVTRMIIEKNMFYNKYFIHNRIDWEEKTERLAELPCDLWKFKKERQIIIILHEMFYKCFSFVCSFVRLQIYKV